MALNELNNKLPMYHRQVIGNKNISSIIDDI